MKLKETLHLGKTGFPMRGNLPNREGEWQKEWDEKDLYGQRQKLNEGKPSFVLHDGPPYANGNIHLGHSLNKISKDIIIRSKSMSGFRAPYVPGWDTHGLPIEQVLAKQGVKRKEMDIVEYRKLCHDYALSQVDKQRADFKRLGVSGDWEHPYVTLTPDYEAAQIRVFGKMAEKGYIYKGLKPIYWSPSSESSLAEAEIEYHDVKSPSIYVAFKVVDGKDLLDTDTSFIIWTTTPWTLPANLGISANPDFDYVQIKADGRKFVVAKDLLETVSKEIGWENVEVLQEFKGEVLDLMTAQHPFYDRTSLLMLGDHVTLDAGTGLVHTAPGHGEEDYIVGKKYGLDVLSPLDSRGCYTAEAPGFEGMFYDKANPVVTKMLEENGSLLKLDFFTHSYPHDWRTKKPVIYRATPQWFASIDKFRQDILDEVEKVDWIIPWGKTRLYNMIRDRGDWVISRQRAWGVPLPVFYAENGEAILTHETIEHVAELFAEYGSNVWFEREAKDLLPEGFTHPGSPNGIFTKETDIMDVWFDSGSSHEGVLRNRPELKFPADMYLEGSDQYRGWFNSSITTSVAINGVAPYKAVLSQGFTLDGEGRKMSKSLGNTIVPETVIKQMGADILRLWVSSVDYEADVRVSMDILAQVSEVYRKIRNTMRFLLANTTDFDPKSNRVAYEDLRSVDKYMMVRLNQTIEQIRKEGYDKYNFLHIYRTVVNFLTVDLSSFYLDFAKDVVYIEAADNHERRCMQTVFYDIAVALTKLLTPIIPHTAEEIWSYLEEEEEYVQLAEFPEVETFANQEELLDMWKAFMDFRDDVLKALEVARNEKLIGKSMEAKVTVYPNEQVRALLTALNTNLPQLLIISPDFFTVSEEGPASAPEAAQKFEDVAILVERAEGHVCDRCRQVKAKLSDHEHLEHVCEHCAEVIESEFPEEAKVGFE
ncbi:isoleucine--tRNA ligase [Enterococcus cecorum]|uniref:Isoleucine--tRNA ligase n=1 Tax=Enterococcus cecorum DSM 20682 = ATCC 43198 TaxID=1121864 RepID=S1R1X8_9ENTE|nr:isoleucine--tRNA ligase [Enterococcus cecorum]EOX19298.1 isoleucyl-tRNA synthetase [Enterococcus cecorum DSM 20682 = ATCC 43198]ESK62042.1 isoleucyl-tRNA synthetase [Enterococcus cecorum DSM 20682 = ATCC 43198]KLO72085.1 isoleucine--tRNA ligase [Enterococcus cecorum]KLO73950.1 isoleucine--tRNA ligase [Enterococcus cecorum]OJG34231.1 isoleucyl-tRNA synthetase [Enterococcus cecorum DSM 20682 = ATCC 43198]